MCKERKETVLTALAVLRKCIGTDSPLSGQLEWDRVTQETSTVGVITQNTNRSNLKEEGFGLDYDFCEHIMAGIVFWPVVEEVCNLFS